MTPRLRPGIHVVGIDDAPDDRSRRGDVLVVGAVYRGGTAFDGLLTTRIRRDGWNATDRIAAMLVASKFHAHLAYVLLDGITVGGFNVIDIHALHRRTGLKVAAVMRRPPDLDAIRRAVQRLPGPERRWTTIRSAGPIHRAGRIHVQLAGLAIEEARALVAVTATRSFVPEPIRAAHLIAGGLVRGESGRGG
jgi:hypothetical protein